MYSQQQQQQQQQSAAPPSAPPKPPEMRDLPRFSLPRVSLYDVAAREVTWGVDFWVRTFVSIFALRTVSLALGQWWFVKEAWGVAPALLDGFGPPKPQPAPAGTASGAGGNPGAYSDEDWKRQGYDKPPRFLFAEGNDRFWAHTTKFATQAWPCPLLKTTPCFTCPHFVHDLESNVTCAAVFKAAARNNPTFAMMSLKQIRDFLQESMGGNGMGAAQAARASYGA